MTLKAVKILLNVFDLFDHHQSKICLTPGVFIVEGFCLLRNTSSHGNRVRPNDWTRLLTNARYKRLPLFSYSSMNERWLENPTRTCNLGVSLCAWLFPTAIDIWMLVDTNFQVACCFANVCLSTNTCALEMTCEGCMF